ncbi:MAG: (2Fe-2S)-binding protein [Candidatus Krumholzibacteria bacterium]|nr:(2Fe-2S)-binding protein [Candidatus Krumholzibacteria bacterium]
MSITLTVNGIEHSLDVDERMPLLWALRDVLGFTGTKFGCGIARCGACTVHVDGVARRSCTIRIGRVRGKSVTTIEGLSDTGQHPLQKAWLDHNVPQCGYCQAGQIMSAAALLANNTNPSDADIDSTLRDCICRCGTYRRIRAAIKSAANEMRTER